MHKIIVKDPEYPIGVMLCPFCKSLSTDATLYDHTCEGLENFKQNMNTPMEITVKLAEGNE